MTDLKSKIYAVMKVPQLMPMATLNEEGKPWVRYVVGIAAEDLTVRVATSLQTRKCRQIQKDPEVHMACGASSLESMSPYVQIAGRADITTDKEEKHRLWNDELKAYFSGPDDPNYCVIIIKPYHIEYMGEGMIPEVWQE